MKHGGVYCESCACTIEHRAELITCLKGASLVAYHSSCYAHLLRDGIEGFMISAMPINGSRFLGASIASSVIVIGLSIFSRLWWLLLVLLFLVGVRFWSWYLFESKL